MRPKQPSLSLYKPAWVTTVRGTSGGGDGVSVKTVNAEKQADSCKEVFRRTCNLEDTRVPTGVQPKQPGVYPGGCPGTYPTTTKITQTPVFANRASCKPASTEAGALTPALFTGHDLPDPRVGPGGLRNLTGRVGSGRVGSAGNGNLTGRDGSRRVGSGGFQISRVGPDPPDPTPPARRDLTRENLWLIRSTPTSRPRFSRVCSVRHKLWRIPGYLLKYDQDSEVFTWRVPGYLPEHQGTYPPRA